MNASDTSIKSSTKVRIVSASSHLTSQNDKHKNKKKKKGTKSILKEKKKRKFSKRGKKSSSTFIKSSIASKSESLNKVLGSKLSKKGKGGKKGKKGKKSKGGKKSKDSEKPSSISKESFLKKLNEELNEKNLTNYGPTMDSVFEKQRREKIFKIHRKPYFKNSLKFILCLLNFVTSMLIISISFYWIFNLRDFFNNTEEEEDEKNIILYNKGDDGLTTGNTTNDRIQNFNDRYGVHALCYIVIFSFFVPLVTNLKVCLNCVTSVAIVIIDGLLKMATSGLYIFSYFSIRHVATTHDKVDTGKLRTTGNCTENGEFHVDGNVHVLFSDFAHFVMVLWLFSSLINLIGTFCPKIYNIRLGIGFMFKEFANGSLHDMIVVLN